MITVHINSTSSIISTIHTASLNNLKITSIIIKHAFFKILTGDGTQGISAINSVEILDSKKTHSFTHSHAYTLTDLCFVKVTSHQHTKITALISKQVFHAVIPGLLKLQLKNLTGGQRSATERVQKATGKCSSYCYIQNPLPPPHRPAIPQSIFASYNTVFHS